MAVTALLRRMGGARLPGGLYRTGRSAFMPYMNHSPGSAFSAFTSTLFWDLQTGTISGVGDIGSAEAFGLLDLSVTIIGVGDVSSTEAFGLLSVGALIGLIGIASEEAFGTPTIIWVSAGAHGTLRMHVENGITQLTTIWWG